MQKKNYVYPSGFLKYYKDIANLLFWLLWLHPPKATAATLAVNSMFICKHKINLFSQLLHSNESCKYFGQ